VEAGYRESRFRESRDQQGNLTHVSGPKRLALIEDMVVVDVESGQKVRLKDLTEFQQATRAA
jgi:hypothetical protein